MEIVIRLNDEDIAKGVNLADLLGTAAKEPKKTKKSKPEEPAPAEPEEAPEPAKDEKLVTKADVRAKALEITKAGKSDELKAVFESFGVSKLSELKESDYADCLAKLQEV